jgi:CheY-like chemotaxis protein/thiamine kinase-like enzyme
MESVHALIIDDTPAEIEPILAELTRRFSLGQIHFSYSIVDSAAAAVGKLSQDKSFDLVFLDIVGIDPYNLVIPQILEFQPYLPIMMLSRQEDSDEIISCVDLGASSFIIKSRLVTGVRPLNKFDEWRDEQNWKDVVDKIREKVKEYRPWKRMINAPLEIGTLRKRGDKDSIIADQINFLRYAQGKPAIAEFFPTLQKDWPEGEFTFYEMPFFRMESLRHLIFQEADRESCLENSKSVLDKVLEFVFKQLYSEDKRNAVYEGFVQQNYFEKYQSRLRQTKSILPSLKKTHRGEITAYEKLLSSKHIEIGARQFRNPTDILRELESTEVLVKRLEPPFLNLIHGDLHFDNILVNNRVPKRIKIKLIDPRGFRRVGYAPGTGDVAYDVGKLLHSAHGYYDLIHAGYWTAKINSFEFGRNRVKAPTLQRGDWVTVPQTGGGSGDIITSHKQMVQPWTWSAFDELAQYLRDWIIERSGHPQVDHDWWLRARFNEAVHFCTMGKFHVQDDVGRAIAIQLRGIELMNEFDSEYRSGALDT